MLLIWYIDQNTQINEFKLFMMLVIIFKAVMNSHQTQLWLKLLKWDKRAMHPISKVPFSRDSLCMSIHLYA